MASEEGSIDRQSPSNFADFELEEATVTAQRAAMQAGAVTARAIVEMYLDPDVGTLIVNWRVEAS